jgi:hypothetical protein
MAIQRLEQQPSTAITYWGLRRSQESTWITKQRRKQATNKWRGNQPSLPVPNFDFKIMMSMIETNPWKRVRIRRRILTFLYVKLFEFNFLMASSHGSRGQRSQLQNLSLVFWVGGASNINFDRNIIDFLIVTRIPHIGELSDSRDVLQWTMVISDISQERVLKIEERFLRYLFTD